MTEDTRALRETDEGLLGYTFPKAFLAAVAGHQSEVAIVGERSEFTWGQWLDRANSLAGGLQQIGTSPGDVVAARLPNGIDFLSLHVAAALAGAIFLPIHVEADPSDTEAILRRTRPKVLVDGQVLTGDSRTPVAGSIAELVAGHEGATPDHVEVRPESPFVLVSSSGTTSARPKLCLHTHDGLLSNARRVLDDSTMSGGGTMVCASPFSFLFGMLSIHVSVLGGARQAVLTGWDVNRFASLAHRVRPTALYAVPAQLQDILRAGAAIPRLREVRTGGIRIPRHLAAEVRRSLADHFLTQWGMSELGAGTYTVPGDPLSASDTIGRPVRGARARVVDPAGREGEPGRTGELQVRSPYRFQRYYEDTEATERAFTADGWLRTTDLVSWTEDGYLRFQSRSAEVINVGGRKVSATDIEQLVADMPGIADSAVVARSDERLGEVPWLVCALRPGATVSTVAVARHLQAKGVAPYKIPAGVTVVDDIPRTPTGKIARSRVLAATRQLADVVELVSTAVAATAGVDSPGSIHPDATFRDSGIASSGAARLAAEISAATGVQLASDALYSFPTPRVLAEHIVEKNQSGETVTAEAGTPTGDDDLAIVGIGCRLPGGISSPDQFWGVLDDGDEVRTPLPTDRGWPLGELRFTGPGGVPFDDGAFLDDIASFDAEFFGITGREARAMDPQHRLLLETCWEALERAGITKAQLRGSDTGVFVGMMPTDYGPRWSESPHSYDGALGIGTSSSFASGRISYLLGLHGPAVTVDTACSSSLMALHLAAQALKLNECETAIVAGVTVMSSPANLVEFSQQHLLAPDARCKAFGRDADGVGLSEGAGAIVVQRLGDARRLGRRVLAVVRGSAVVQDGASNGLTAPNGRAQELVAKKALAAAGLHPADIDVVEGHGTGTALGDPIEVRALQEVYGKRKLPVWLGSVKSNIGHTQAAAGVVSIIKMVLAIENGRLPRTLHAQVPSPEIDWAGGAVRLLTEAVEWPRTPARVRRAAVSSFGMSGTNVHVILEEPPPGEPIRAQQARTAAGLPWLLSAKNGVALQEMAADLERVLDARPDVVPADIGRALATTRTLFDHRAAVFPHQEHGYRAGLNALSGATRSGEVVSGVASAVATTVFVFGRAPADWAATGSQLLTESDVFARIVADCAAALRPHASWSLVDAIRAGSADDAAVDRAARFAVMVGLAALWRTHGVTPDAVVGHGLGELAAAQVSGALSIGEALQTALAAEQPVKAVPDLRIPGVGRPRRFIHIGQDEQTLRAVDRELRANDGQVITASDGMGPFLRSLAEAHVHGAAVDWTAVFGAAPADARTLPTYPFQRLRFWLGGSAGASAESEDVVADESAVARLLGLSDDERRAELFDVVRRAVVRVVEPADPSKISIEQDLADLGVESLASIELRNILARELDINIPIPAVIDQRAIKDLVAVVDELIVAERASRGPQPSSEHAATDLAELPQDLESICRMLYEAGNADSVWQMLAPIARLRLQGSGDSLPVATVQLVKGREKPSIVCFPSILSLGGATEYERLAGSFSGVRDVHHVELPGFRSGEPLPATLDALLDYTVNAVARITQGDLVVLAGRSYGAWIAHLTAHRLAETGRPPAGVVLLDTYWPGEEFIRKYIPRSLQRVVERYENLGTARLTAIGWYLQLLSAGVSDRSDAETLHVLPESQTGVETHLRGPGWLTPNTTVAVPGDHFTMLEGDASTTVEAIESWLHTTALRGA